MSKKAKPHVKLRHGEACVVMQYEDWMHLAATCKQMATQPGLDSAGQDGWLQTAANIIDQSSATHYIEVDEYDVEA